MSDSSYIDQRSFLQRGVSRDTHNWLYRQRVIESGALALNGMALSHLFSQGSDFCAEEEREKDCMSLRWWKIPRKQ